jgi:hypothetical protein
MRYDCSPQGSSSSAAILAACDFDRAEPSKQYLKFQLYLEQTNLAYRIYYKKYDSEYNNRSLISPNW